MLKVSKLLGATYLSLLSMNTFAERVIIPPPYEDMQGKRLSSVECLVVNAYHESRSESDIANIMIMSTVLNRVNDRRWASSICGVVFQKKAYSWTGDKLSDKINNLVQYKRLYRLAEHFLINKDTFLKLSQGINHYHSVKVNPYWVGSERMKYVTKVDNHLFYTWRDKPSYRK